MSSTLAQPPLREQPPTRARGAVRALLLANVRFWIGVAPPARSELRRWRRSARLIDDPLLGELALGKLSREGFNAEVAATLATLSPRPARAAAVRAIVALEVLFDYLDGRTELPLVEPIEDGLRLFGPFTQALCQAPEATPSAVGLEREPDRLYLAALGARTRENLFSLSGAAVVVPLAQAAAERCVQAQTRLHAESVLGDRQLERWARDRAAGSGLGWREYLAGCASSVLAVHALIAAAADPNTTARDAQRIDHAYFAIGAVITMLDSLVDRRADAVHGEAGFIELFADEQDFRDSLRTLIAEALARARQAPHAEHHAMTLAGIAAFYTTHPGARDPRARALVRMVRAELSPTIWPAIAVMRGWRLAKRVGGRTRRLSFGGAGR